MIRRHQRWTALFIAFVLHGLVLGSTVPPTVGLAENPCLEKKSNLAKDNSPEELITLESDGPAPGFVEQAGSAWGQGSEKNTERAVILGIVAIAIVWVIIRYVIRHVGRD